MKRAWSQTTWAVFDTKPPKKFPASPAAPASIKPVKEEKMYLKVHQPITP